jgi:hypothetical protein
MRESIPSARASSAATSVDQFNPALKTLSPLKEDRKKLYNIIHSCHYV